MRITEQTAQQLVLYDPPAYVLGVLLLIVGGVLASAAFPNKPGDQYGVLWIALAPGVALILIGAMAATGTRRITLSQPEGTLRIEKAYFGVTVSDRSVVLADVATTQIVTDRYQQRLYAVMRSGKLIALSGRATRSGLGMAEAAIQERLGL